MNPSAANLRRLELLGKIIQLVDHGQEQVTPGALMVDKSDDEERMSVGADARALSDEALIVLDERFAGAWIARPTREGRHAWEGFLKQRSSASHRRSQLLNDYLGWVYEQSQDGSYAVADEFLESGAEFLGDRYSLHELMRAGEWLANRDLIEGPGVDQRPDPLRPRITAKGEHFVDAGRDVRSIDQEGSTSYTILGNVQIAHGSHHVSQVQTSDSVGKDALDLAAALHQVVAALPEGTRERVAGLADQLQEEAEGDARPPRLRSIGESVLRAFGSGAGGALGTALTANVAAWLSTLA